MTLSTAHPSRRTDAVDDVPDRSSGLARNGITVVVVALVTLVGPALLLALTDRGIHATPDSFTYLGAADQLAHGRGWTYPFGEIGSPVTLFPPGYPLVLAIPAALGVDPFDWVRWQNALLLAVLGGTVGWVVLRETRGHVVPAVLAIVLVQLGVPTTQAYARIWSETFFFPLVVVALAAIARHLLDRRRSSLVLAAVTIGIAMLTRYAGFALFVTAAALLLAWPGRTVRERARATITFVLVAALPNALWVLRNSLTSGTLTGNNELIHELHGADVVDGLVRVSRWLVPEHLPGTAYEVLVAIALVASVVLAIGSVRLLVRGRRLRELAPSAIVPVCLAYVLIHFLFIVAANAFSTRAPPFNDRILGPAFAPLVIALVVTGDAIWRRAGDRIVRVAVAAVAASILGLSIVAATDAMPSIYGAPAGSRDAYRALGRSLEPVVPEHTPLFATRPSVVWFLLREPVSSLPRSCQGGRVVPNPSFRQELTELAERLGDGPRAVIVFRGARQCEPYSISLLRRQLRLVRAGPPGAPGRVWVLTGPPERTSE